MLDITTTAGREELRRPDARDWPTIRDSWDRALDGLDIAQEVAEALKETEKRRRKGSRPGWEVALLRRNALAKWDKWLDIYSPPPPS